MDDVSLTFAEEFHLCSVELFNRTMLQSTELRVQRSSSRRKIFLRWSGLCLVQTLIQWWTHGSFEASKFTKLHANLTPYCSKKQFKKSGQKSFSVSLSQFILILILSHISISFYGLERVKYSTIKKWTCCIRTFLYLFEG